MFGDKGVAIQNARIANYQIKVRGWLKEINYRLWHQPLQTDDMIEQLASLLLPIDALLAYDAFNPHINASPEVVALFRNMWFLCILFHLTSPTNKEETAMDWLKPALARISLKTPFLVVEESHDSAASEVEYNSVIRQDYATTVSFRHSRISRLTENRLLPSIELS